MSDYSLPRALPEALLPWYHAGHRDLPWRKDREPYHIWVSEIMLQQTRVEAVRSYYARFLENLPTVQALAACDDDQLHKLWEGLGYYSRVKNMKKAAQAIVSDHGGHFPEDYTGLLSLPGIGDYTAGAIASIAFGLPTPAVDGNVLRVCSRIADDHSPIDLPETKKRVRSALADLYPEEAGAFTQALMELGATLCGPNRKPDCSTCPCSGFCLGYQRGTADTLPVKAPKKAKREEDLTVFILSCGEKYALRRRPEKGLLAGLWEFPNVSGKLEMPKALEAVQSMSLSPVNILRQTERKHIFTHIQWNLRGYYLEVREESPQFFWFTPAQIQENAALPTAFRQFWEELNHV